MVVTAIAAEERVLEATAVSRADADHLLVVPNRIGDEIAVRKHRKFGLNRRWSGSRQAAGEDQREKRERHSHRTTLELTAPHGSYNPPLDGAAPTSLRRSGRAAGHG